MDSEVLSVYSQTTRERAGRRLLRSLAMVLLILVGAAATWVCVGVTRWGPYTL